MKNQLAQINAAVYRRLETKPPQPVAGHTPAINPKTGVCYAVYPERCCAPRLARENEALKLALEAIITCPGIEYIAPVFLEQAKQALAPSTPKTPSDAATGQPEGKE